MARYALLSAKLFKDPYLGHIYEVSSVVVHRQLWPLLRKSMNAETTDSTRLLHSLASKCKWVVYTWEMCSKTIDEIVLKVVRQNTKEAHDMLCHEKCDIEELAWPH